MIPTITWEGGEEGFIRLLDQTQLPDREIFLEIRDTAALVEAIVALRIRGAPAIGVAGAYGVALAASNAARGERAQNPAASLRALAAVEEEAGRLRNARPTAVNLAWGVDRALRRYRHSIQAGSAPREAAAAALAEARAIHEEDLAMSRAMGAAGAALLSPGARVLTHCNTGGLATGGLGTALAVVFAAARAGLEPRVFVDETRPLLQGARLTAWELMREGIAATLLVDGAAASLLASGAVDVVLVGADRVAANGDTANKVGTYAVAIAAARHGVPFHVVAPSSSFDLSCPAGSAITVEQRDPGEVRAFRGQLCAPAGVSVWNPAFDVTPAELIRGWVTERGLVVPPFTALQGGGPGR
ncbi:MAG: S-methyl-5-thioribose-1-phosphate isomerase [Candidatus Eisenbacteria bacterium]|nr:S-methyl-5-thioribose-1-phosphate isomerase [Candidatus Eisenbacteria bacterium]